MPKPIKTIHRFKVYGTDENRVGDFTRWIAGGYSYASRASAWRAAKTALKAGGFRYVKVIEERVFKGAD